MRPISDGIVDSLGRVFLHRPIMGVGLGVNVLDFPGVDPSGASDSSAGVQAALTYVISIGGGELLFPNGTYNFGVRAPTDPLHKFLIAESNIWIIGEGEGTFFTYDSDAPLFRIEPRIGTPIVGGGFKLFKVTNTRIIADAHAQGRGTLYYSNINATITGPLIEDVLIDTTPLTGITFEATKGNINRVRMRNLGEHGVYAVTADPINLPHGNVIANLDVEGICQVAANVSAAAVKCSAQVDLKVKTLRAVFGAEPGCFGVFDDTNAINSEYSGVTVTQGGDGQIGARMLGTDGKIRGLAVDTAAGFPNAKVLLVDPSAVRTRVAEVKQTGTVDGNPVDITGSTDTTLDGGDYAHGGNNAAAAAIEASTCVNPTIINQSILSGSGYGVNINGSSGARVDVDSSTALAPYLAAGATNFQIRDKTGYRTSMLVAPLSAAEGGIASALPIKRILTATENLIVPAVPGYSADYPIALPGAVAGTFAQFSPGGMPVADIISAFGCGSGIDQVSVRISRRQIPILQRTSLVGWFDSTRGITVVGGKVSVWANQGFAGATLDLAQATAGLRFLYNVNGGPFGEPTVTAVAASSTLMTSGAFTLNQPCTVLIVFNPVNTGGTSRYICDALAANGRGFLTNSGNLELYAGAGPLIAGACSNGNWHYAGGCFNGVNSTTVLDGTSQTGDTGANAASGLTVGSVGGGGNYYDGEIRHILLYNEVLTVDEQASALNELAQLVADARTWRAIATEY